MSSLTNALFLCIHIRKMVPSGVYRWTHALGGGGGTTMFGSLGMCCSAWCLWDLRSKKKYSISRVFIKHRTLENSRYWRGAKFLLIMEHFAFYATLFLWEMGSISTIFWGNCLSVQWFSRSLPLFETTKVYRQLNPGMRQQPAVSKWR